MTASVQNAALNHATDATFRAWGKAMSDAMLGAGMVRTADTGQINWTTVTKAAAGGFAGYEMFAFADSLQATAPIFVKVEYGTNASPTGPKGQWTIGTATDGAGNFVGNTLVVPFFVTSSLARTDATVLPTYACHAAGYLATRPFNGAASNFQAFLAIERIHNSAGQPLGTGFNVIYHSSSNSTVVGSSYFYDTATFSSATSISTRNVAAPLNGTGLVVGTSVLVFPYLFLTKDQADPLHKTLGLLVCGGGDFPMDADAIFTRYDGLSHTFRRVDTLGSAATNSGLLMRFE